MTQTESKPARLGERRDLADALEEVGIRDPAVGEVRDLEPEAGDRGGGVERHFSLLGRARARTIPARLLRDGAARSTRTLRRRARGAPRDRARRRPSAHRADLLRARRRHPVHRRRPQAEALACPAPAREHRGAPRGQPARRPLRGGLVDALVGARGRHRAHRRAGEAEHERAVELLVSRYPQYRDAPALGDAIVVAITRFSGWTSG